MSTVGTRLRVLTAAVIVVLGALIAPATAGAVANGSPAPRLPWLARIVTDSGQLCTGSLVAPTWVLTARHCFSGKRTGTIKLGERSDTKLRFSTVVTHPTADAALVGLDTAVLDRLPVLASPINAAVGTPVTFHGFGLDRFPAQSGYGTIDQFQPVDDEFTRVFVNNGGGTVTEPGDSGGPLLDGDLLVGVLRGISHDSRHGTRGLYTAVAPLTGWLITTALTQVPAASS